MKLISKPNSYFTTGYFTTYYKKNFGKSYVEYEKDSPYMQITDTKNEYLINFGNVLSKKYKYDYKESYKIIKYSLSESFNVIHNGEKKNIASIIINKKEHSINNIDELLVFLNQEFKFFGNITDEFFVFSKDGSDEKTKIFTNKLISDFYESKLFDKDEFNHFLEIKISKLINKNDSYESCFEYETIVNPTYLIINKTEYQDIDSYLFFSNNKFKWKGNDFVISQFLKNNYSDNYFVEKLYSLDLSKSESNLKKLYIYKNIYNNDFLYDILFYLLSNNSGINDEKDIIADMSDLDSYNFLSTRYEKTFKKISDIFFNILDSNKYELLIESLFYNVEEEISNELISDDSYTLISGLKEKYFYSYGRQELFLILEYLDENISSIYDEDENYDFDYKEFIDAWNNNHFMNHIFFIRKKLLEDIKLIMQ